MPGYYDPADDSIVLRASQGLVIRRWFFKTDIDNKRIENITSRMLTGNVSWSKEWQDGTPMAATFTYLDEDQLDPMTDFVAPVIRYEWGRNIEQRSQVGLFALRPMSSVLSPTGVVSTIKGRDLTWVMGNSFLSKNENLSAGLTYDAAFRKLANDSGISRTNIRPSQFSLTRGRTMRRLTHRREQFNNFAKSIGWYGAQMDLLGKITTLPYRNIHRVAAVGLITPANIISAEVLEPSEEIPNVVIVRADRGDKDPIVSVYRNNKRDSPSSIQNRNGLEVTHEVQANNIEDQASADALAKKTMQDLSEYVQRLNVVVPADIALLGINQRVDVALNIGNKDYSGKYAIRRWEMGFEEDTCDYKLELGLTIDTD